MKPKTDRYGYLVICLRDGNGKKKYPTIHRLVALTFIPNNDMSKNVVNHKDGNKKNNYYKNLEWTTVRNNTIHAYEIGLISTASALEVTDLVTNKTKTYRSIQQFAKTLNMDNRTVVRYIKHSFEYPLLNRYMIKIMDLNAYRNNLNSKHFGRNFYLYDAINNQLTIYDSRGYLFYDTKITMVKNTDLKKK